MANITYRITLIDEGRDTGPNYEVYTSVDCIDYTFIESITLEDIADFVDVSVDESVNCIRLFNNNVVCNNFRTVLVGSVPTTTTTTTTAGPTTTTTAGPTTTTTAGPTTTSTTTLAPTTTTTTTFVAECEFDYTISNIDVSTTNFITATGITNPNLIAAINEFVVDLKTNNIWNDVVQIIPFVADDTASLSTQFGFNLKDTASLNPTFRRGFSVITDLSGSNFNGYKANKGTEDGFSGGDMEFMDTGFIPNDVWSATGPFYNGHVSIYTTDAASIDGPGDFQSGSGDVWDWGGGQGGGSLSGSVVILGRFFNNPEFQPNTVQKISNLGASDITLNNQTPVAGYYISTFRRNTGGIVSKYIQNGTLIGSSSAFDRKFSPRTAYLGAAHLQLPAIQARSNRRYQLLTVGNSLTDAQIAELNTIVHKFQQNIDAAMGTNRTVNY
jgi:hypothetical protein